MQTETARGQQAQGGMEQGKREAREFDWATMTRDNEIESIGAHKLPHRLHKSHSKPGSRQGATLLTWLVTRKQIGVRFVDLESKNHQSNQEKKARWTKFGSGGTR